MKVKDTNFLCCEVWLVGVGGRNAKKINYPFPASQCSFLKDSICTACLELYTLAELMDMWLYETAAIGVICSFLLNLLAFYPNCISIAWWIPETPVT